MASYLKKVLLPDEKVIHIASLHWVIYLRGLVITICGGLLGYYSYYITNYLFGQQYAQQLGKPLAGISLFIVLVGTAFLLAAYIRQTATELAVTNRRIIAKYGFISRTTFEIMISRVTGANFEQTVTGRMLGYGTILVHGAGGEISPIDLVSHPQEYHRALMGVLERVQSAIVR